MTPAKAIPHRLVAEAEAGEEVSASVGRSGMAIGILLKISPFDGIANEQVDPEAARHRLGDRRAEEFNAPLMANSQLETAIRRSEHGTTAGFLSYSIVS